MNLSQTLQQICLLVEIKINDKHLHVNQYDNTVVNVVWSQQFYQYCEFPSLRFPIHQ